MEIIDRTTPIWQLTVEQLEGVIKRAMAPAPPKEEQWCRGWERLKAATGLSEVTLRKYRDEGYFEGAVKSDGRVVFVKVNKALENLAKNKMV